MNAVKPASGISPRNSTVPGRIAAAVEQVRRRRLGASSRGDLDGEQPDERGRERRARADTTKVSVVARDVPRRYSPSTGPNDSPPYTATDQ